MNATSSSAGSRTVRATGSRRRVRAGGWRSTAPGWRPTRPTHAWASPARFSHVRISHLRGTRAGASRVGARPVGRPAARRGREVVAGRGRDRLRPSVERPGGVGRSVQPHRRRAVMGRGGMVIGAFVLARLLGIRLLTLEAQVVVHGGDHDEGSGPLVLAQVPADRSALSSARPARRVPPGRPALSPARPGRREPLGGPALPGFRAAGSGRLTLAMRLVEQGADTLERIRRAKYRG